jgi:protein CpxP
MKKIIVAAFAFLLACGSGWAQDNKMDQKVKKSPEARAEAHTKRINKLLTLDQTQMERVKAINLDKFKQVEAVRSSNPGDRKGNAGKIKTINDNYLNTLKGVLTPEQFAKYQAMKDDKKEDRKEDRKEKSTERREVQDKK